MPYKFYLEPEVRNVIAVDMEQETLIREGWESYEGWASLYDYDNSPVTWAAMRLTYIQQCLPVTEHQAINLHPALFERISEQMESGGNY